MSATRKPWMKFYPSDWRADQTLRVCGLAARGLWIECMAIMHEADPYGHLVISGKTVTDATLARLTGASLDQLTDLLRELEDAGVFSRTRNGTIYSRRMTRDEKKAKTARKNGKLNDTLSNGKDGQIPPSVGGSVGSSVGGVGPPQSPEARVQKPERKKSRGGEPPPEYVFEGRVIKLKRRELDKWAESYPAVPDMMAELQSADDHYAENPPADGKWFFRTSSWLRRANNQAKEDHAAANYGVDSW